MSIGKFPVPEKLIAHPELIEQLDYDTTLEVTLDVLDLVVWPLVKKLVREGWAREVTDAHKRGDHLLTLKEVSERLKRSPKSISQGWRKGRYPFMLKDGAHLVGSQDGLDRWIKARTSRSA